MAQHDRGKRRSSSQKIGQLGEKAFALWAVANRLVPNKAEDDFGMDYYCEILEAAGGSEEAIGTILAAQVKTMGGNKSLSFILDRIDALNILRQEQPTCIFGVAVATGEIRYSFRNELLIDQLIAFVNSDKKTLTVRFREMSGSEGFGSGLRWISRSTTQQRLRLFRAEQLSRISLPHARVEVTQTSRGSNAMLSAPWIGGAFWVDPSLREDVRLNFFGRGTAPELGPGILLHPSHLHLLALADSKLILAGDLETEEIIAIQSGSQVASAVFKVRNFGDEWSLTSSSGLCLMWSETRFRENGETKVDLYTHLSDAGKTLGESAEDLPFLKLVRPGSTIMRNGRFWSKVETFGPGLGRLASSIEKLERIGQAFKVDVSSAKLSDFRNRLFTAPLVILDLIGSRSGMQADWLPMWVDGVGSQDAADGMPSRIRHFQLPLVLNFLQRGIIVWFEVIGLVYSGREGEFAGLQALEVLGYTWEATPPAEGLTYPEFWVGEGYPPVQFAAKDVDESRVVQPDYTRKSLRGVGLRFLDEKPSAPQSGSGK